jgi:hypothetical protein
MWSWRETQISDDPAFMPVATDILDAFVENWPLSALDIEAAVRESPDRMRLLGMC